MAGEDYGTGSSNVNPSEWITGYSVANNTDITLDVADATGDAQIDIANADLVAASGDVRSAYHAIIRQLFHDYNTKNTDGTTNMPDDMVMTKSTVKNVTPPSSQSTQTHVYTFRIKENIANNLSGALSTLVNPSSATSPALPAETND